MSDVNRPFEIFRVSVPDGEYSRRADVVEKIHYDAAQADIVRLERKNANQCETIHGYQDTQSQLAALREELANLSETNRLFSVAHEDSRQHVIKIEQRLADAERRNAELVESCAKICEERAAYYDSGDDDAPGSRRASACQNCADVIRWRKPDINPKPDACKSDGGTCGLGGYCAECPHSKPEAASHDE